jgi:hypothetical protein
MPEIKEWKSIYNELPYNEQVVWIRVLSIFGQIAKAVYKEENGGVFVTVDTSVSIPVYFVARWRKE